MTRNRTNTRMRLCRLWLFFATSLSLPVNPPRVIASEQTQATYRLVVNTDIPGFGADALAERLKAELGVNIVVASEGAEGFGVLTVSWRSSRGEMAVSFHDPSRGVVLRVVSAPADVDKAMQLSVLLAANLFRDDATELMGPTPAPAPSPPAVVPPDPVSQAAATPLPSQRQYKLATFSFLHPLSTNGSDPDIRTRLNLNLLYGRVGELDGLQLGFFGVVGGNASGAQLSFLANVTQGTMEGIQGASVFNLAKGGVVGLQVAFLSNLSGSRVKGVKASLGANVAREKVTGGQVSSVNVADDVEGFQIGFINVANKVKGLQLGLINVADDVEGVPLGLVSVTKSGGGAPHVLVRHRNCLQSGDQVCHPLHLFGPHGLSRSRQRR